MYFTKVKMHAHFSHTLCCRNLLVSQQLSHAFFGAWFRLRTFLFLEEENEANVNRPLARELRPVDEKTDKEEELKELYVTLEVYYTKLWNKLDSEGKDLLDELRDCHTDIMYLENEGTFIQGFSLATKMINEALSD